MHASLPAIIDPILLAERGTHLAGTLSVRGMARLRELCQDDGGEVAVELCFGYAQGENRARMTGRLHVTLHVTCQRCLERMDLTLSVTPHLLFLRPGEPEKAGIAEDIMVVDRPLSLNTLVEDELLLAMPMIPMHEPDVCPARREAGQARVIPRR